MDAPVAHGASFYHRQITAHHYKSTKYAMQMSVIGFTNMRIFGIEL